MKSGMLNWKRVIFISLLLCSIFLVHISNDVQQSNNLRRTAESEEMMAMEESDTTHNSCKCVNCDEDEICGGLWRGVKYPPIANNIMNDDLHSKHIHIVISHCTKDLHPLATYIQGFDIESVHIISKCGVPVVGIPEEMNAITTIEVLPNVGRCDHSYAHYITTILDKKVAPSEENNSVILFLKDDMSNRNMHQGPHFQPSWNDIESMVRVASSTNGFACGTVIKPNAKQARSIYHERDSIMQFTIRKYKRNNQAGPNIKQEMFRSNFTDLGSFVNNIDIGPLPNLVQVCYGGVFAASVSNIKKVKTSVWNASETMLSRGDNIQEGHYMERSWGMLLSTPLQHFQMDALLKCTTMLERGDYNGMMRKPLSKQSCDFI